MLLIDGFPMLRQTGRNSKQLSSTKNQKMKRAPSPSSCQHEAASVSALCWGWLGEGFYFQSQCRLVCSAVCVHGSRFNRGRSFAVDIVWKLVLLLHNTLS